MIRRRTLALFGLVFMIALAVGADPRAQAGQLPKDALQRILDLVRSFGDVSTSWSRALPSDERFVVLTAFNNDAVLDRNTGLVWERSPIRNGRHYVSAQYACLSATTGGQMGWRLPSISELTSLVDPGNTNPALPAGSPFELGGHAFFWSATRRVLLPDIAWGFNMRDGFVDDYEFDLSVSVWCVRGGTNSDEH
jgi:Protein of unknown function (DUF1566)